MNFRTPLSRLRLMGLIEGISAVLLFFVAMPAKYTGCPYGKEMVTYIGAAHGGLWIVFVLAVLQVWLVRSWGLGRVFAAGVASIVPIGTFLLDVSLKQEQLRAEQIPQELPTTQ